MKIALAQINTTVGALESNFNKIKENVNKAIQQNAELIIFPELTIPGYPPLDLLYKKVFVDQCLSILSRVTELSKSIDIVVGCVTKDNDSIGTNIFNSAVHCSDGRIKSIHNKTLLPNYDVFDEVRYFESSKQISLATIKNKKFGISICEDAWNDKEFWKHRLYPEDPIEKMIELGSEFIINISASPFSIGKEKIRTEMFSSLAKKYKRIFIHVNQVGANTDLIFDGASKVFNTKGDVIVSCKKFQEDFVIFDTISINHRIEYQYSETIEDIYNALILGIKDYFSKTNFKKAVIGLSGGIDSALVTTLATKALGKENVICVLMPSQYSSKGSIDDSLKLLRNLGIKEKIISIEKIFNLYKEILKQEFNGLPEDITEENLQARIRGNILMAFSNKFGYLLLSTGNKSELACGYATLYGDMCGGLAVISDVYKTTVYELAKFINRNSEIIPIEIIKKAPSAELKPNQTDQDTLPPYEILDKILYHYIEEWKEEEELIELGFNPDTVRKVLKMVDRNEYKRKQTAPGLKVTTKAFGMGRRFPIVQGWR